MSAWIDQIFEANAANNGGIVRRSIEDVMRNASIENLVAAAKAREFHVIITGGQCVVLCHKGKIEILC